MQVPSLLDVAGWDKYIFLRNSFKFIGILHLYCLSGSCPNQNASPAGDVVHIPTLLVLIPTDLELIPTDLVCIPTPLVFVPTDLVLIPTDLVLIPTHLVLIPTRVRFV
jgi:hypothetical protein